jgi:hypothetical protein
VPLDSSWVIPCELLVALPLDLSRACTHMSKQSIRGGALSPLAPGLSAAGDK